MGEDMVLFELSNLPEDRGPQLVRLGKPLMF